MEANINVVGNNDTLRVRATTVGRVREAVNETKSSKASELDRFLQWGV